MRSYAYGLAFKSGLDTRKRRSAMRSGSHFPGGGWTLIPSRTLSQTANRKAIPRTNGLAIFLSQRVDDKSLMVVPDDPMPTRLPAASARLSVNRENCVAAQSLPDHVTLKIVECCTNVAVTTTELNLVHNAKAIGLCEPFEIARKSPEAPAM